MKSGVPAVEGQERGGGNRRPLASRSTAWAATATRLLLRAEISPNQISLLSILFAAVGAAAIWYGQSWWHWLLAALCVQLRLLCNLLDGMVAIEGGKGTPVGALFNEVPDRVADSLFLVPLGHAVGLDWAGWLAALLAMMTAYVRVLGGALGQPQDFAGIMAKQKRMAALTLGLVLQAVESLFWPTVHALALALVLIVLGSAWTCWTRAAAIAGRLEGRP